MFNYTIIIPHNNSAELLEYCLSTIPVRDDVQVIVVDDNSDPNKVDFSHFPQWAGKNYEYYLTKEGKGAGYARNVGLEHAKGKWLLFVDADDFLLPTINDIFDECVNSDADIIFFRPKAVMLEDRKTPSNRADWYNGLIDEYFATGDEKSVRTAWASPWSKFIKKSLIQSNSIKFEEIPYANDLFLSISAGCLASKVIVNNTSYYTVTEGTKSLTANYCSKPGELESRANAFYRVQAIVKEYGYEMDIKGIIYYLRMSLVRNRTLFVTLISQMQDLGFSRKYIFSALWRTSGHRSRIKYTPYIIFILYFHHYCPLKMDD